MYDISEYVNPKDPLYIKGCNAIEKKDEERLSEVLKDKDFDKDSYEALGLLFHAAKTAYIKGFQMLGDAGVKMSRPFKVIRRWHYVSVDPSVQLQPVSLTQDKTALHVLIKSINAEALGILYLADHFKDDDIERTLNTYVLGVGTPLQISYDSHLAANQFLKDHNVEGTSGGFWNFYAQMMNIFPNVQAPLLMKDEMIFQRAMRLNDEDTLSLVCLHTINFLNMCNYRYPKNEYEALTRFDIPQDLKDDMLKDFEETPKIKAKKGPFQKIAQFFSRQRN